MVFWLLPVIYQNTATGLVVRGSTHGGRLKPRFARLNINFCSIVSVNGLGGYTLRMYQWRLSLHRDFPNLFICLRSHFYAFRPSCQYSCPIQQCWGDKWGFIGRRLVYFCALLALGLSRFCYIITRGRPKLQLVALVVICHGALLLCSS